MIAAAVKRLFRPKEAVIPPVPLAIKTEDIWKLEQYAAQLIFVPDDLMKGFPNHYLIEEADVGHEFPECYTHNDYTFWRKDLGERSYGVPLPSDFKPEGFVRWEVEALPIRGQLYAIRPSQFIILDKYRLKGVQFERRRVQIKYPYRAVAFSKERPIPRVSPDCFKLVTAWMYFGIPEYWRDQIGGIFTSQISPTDHHYQFDGPRLWAPRYYHFEAG